MLLQQCSIICNFKYIVYLTLYIIIIYWTNFNTDLEIFDNVEVTNIQYTNIETTQNSVSETLKDIIKMFNVH